MAKIITFSLCILLFNYLVNANEENYSQFENNVNVSLNENTTTVLDLEESNQNTSDIENYTIDNMENNINNANNNLNNFQNSDNAYLRYKEIYIMFDKLENKFKDFKDEILEKVYTKAVEDNRKHENLTNFIKEISLERNLTKVNENKRHKDLDEKLKGFKTELQSRDMKENEIHEYLFKTVKEIQENVRRNENIENSNYEKLFEKFEEFKNQTLKEHKEEKNRYRQLFLAFEEFKKENKKDIMWSNSSLYTQNECKNLANQLNSSLNEANNQINIIKQTLNSSLDEANIEINNLKQNPVPIGFIYVQLPSQPDPNVLWSLVEWQDVTSQYAGLFFRAEGGASAKFGEKQVGQSPSLNEASSSWTSVTYDKIPKHTSIPKNGKWSGQLWVGWTPAHGTAPGNEIIKFKLSTDEVRPVNKAIRIWKRIK